MSILWARSCYEPLPAQSPARCPACTNGAHFELKAKHNGAIEMEYPVDSNRAGQVWALRITDNGAVTFADDARHSLIRRRLSLGGGQLAPNGKATERGAGCFKPVLCRSPADSGHDCGARR